MPGAVWCGPCRLICEIILPCVGAFDETQKRIKPSIIYGFMNPWIYDLRARWFMPADVSSLRSLRRKDLQ